MPKVSVIVPNYNHAQFLPERLDSILNQTYQDFEIIILDDASTDNSIEIIKSYLEEYPNKIKFYPSNQNSGSPFIQWEKGIQKAIGDYIWIAESDDAASDIFLFETVSILENNKNPGIVCTNTISINQNGLETGKGHPVVRNFESEFMPPENESIIYEGNQFNVNWMIRRCVIPNASAVVFRKSLVEKAKPFQIKYSKVGDYYFWVKLLQYSNIVFLNKYLNKCRIHDQKVSGNPVKGINLIEMYDIVQYISKYYKVSSKLIYEVNLANFKLILFLLKGQKARKKHLLRLSIQLIHYDKLFLPRSIKYILTH